MSTESASDALLQKKKQAVEATLTIATVAFAALHADKPWPSVKGAKDECPRPLKVVEAERALLLGRCDLVTRAALTPRANEAAEEYKSAMGIQQAVLNFIKQNAILTPPLEDGSTSQVTSVSEAVASIRGFINRSMEYKTATDETRTHLIRYIMGRHTRLTSATEKLSRLEKEVAAHVADRVARAEAWLSADSIDSDALSKIVGFLGYRSAASCVRVCKAFSKMDCIRQMLPHLSVRKIVGSFPHKIIGSKNLVAKRTQTHLYVDLAIKGTLTGDAQRDKWLRATPQHSDAATTPGTRRERLSYESDVFNRRSREAAEELPPHGHYRRRISHQSFFSTPIECSVQLVFADTLEVVDAGLPDPVLDLPKSMRKSNAPVQTYTALDGTTPVPYPAHISFTINDLSGNYSVSRLFKLKVTGTAVTLANERGDKDSEYTQTLIAYSEPFQIVANKTVGTSCRGAKRKRQK